MTCELISPRVLSGSWNQTCVSHTTRTLFTLSHNLGGVEASGAFYFDILQAEIIASKLSPTFCLSTNVSNQSPRCRCISSKFYLSALPPGHSVFSFFPDFDGTLALRVAPRSNERSNMKKPPPRERLTDILIHPEKHWLRVARGAKSHHYRQELHPWLC